MINASTDESFDSESEKESLRPGCIIVKVSHMIETLCHTVALYHSENHSD